MSSPTEHPPRQAVPSRLRNLGLFALLGLLLALAAFLRFDGLGEPSLWLDEILHVHKASEAAGEPWHAWLTGVSVDRENGALYYATQLVGLKLFQGEFGVRFMPALAGIMTVCIAFFIGLGAPSAKSLDPTESGNRRVAAVAAALLAVSPLHVYYSREGRPYAAVMLVAALLLYLALKDRGPWTKVAIYLICIATAFWGAVAAPVLISCAVLAGFEWLYGRFSRRPSFGDQSVHVMMAPIAGLVVSWLLFPEIQRLSGSIAATPAQGKYVAQWDITQPLSGDAFDRLLASLTVSGVDSGTATTLSFLFLALAAWGSMCLMRRAPRKALWTIGLCLLPILGSLAVLVLWKHWYNVRYTAAGLPAFLVLTSMGLVDLWERPWRWVHRLFGGSPTDRSPVHPGLAWGSNLLLVGLLGFLLLPLVRTARAEPLQKPDWRGVASLINDLAAPSEPVITRGSWSETCIRYYLQQLDSEIEVFSANHDIAQATRLAERYPRAWVLSAGYRKTADLQTWMKGMNPLSKSRQANLQLYYHPDFSSFLANPRRVENLLAVAEGLRETGSRQEFTGSELLLGGGWSYPERGPDDLTFRWAMGKKAEVAVLSSSSTGLSSNGPSSTGPSSTGPPSSIGRTTTPPPIRTAARELRLRLMPFPNPDREAQVVSVWADSQPVGDLTLQPGWQEVSLPLPPSRSAAELLTFRFAWSQSPAALNPESGDPRELAVAFDFAEVVSP